MCLFVCLFAVFRPSPLGNCFTHRETSPLPVKGCKLRPMLGAQGHWTVGGSLACHAYWDHLWGPEIITSFICGTVTTCVNDLVAGLGYPTLSIQGILYGRSFTTCSFETMVLCEFISLNGYINKRGWRKNWVPTLAGTYGEILQVCLLTAETKTKAFSFIGLIFKMNHTFQYSKYWRHVFI